MKKLNLRNEIEKIAGGAPEYVLVTKCGNFLVNFQSKNCSTDILISRLPNAGNFSLEDYIMYGALFAKKEG